MRPPTSWISASASGPRSTGFVAATRRRDMTSPEARMNVRQHQSHGKCAPRPRQRRQRPAHDARLPPARPAPRRRRLRSCSRVPRRGGGPRAPPSTCARMSRSFQRSSALITGVRCTSFGKPGRWPHRPPAAVPPATTRIISGPPRASGTPCRASHRVAGRSTSASSTRQHDRQQERPRHIDRGEAGEEGKSPVRSLRMAPRSAPGSGDCVMRRNKRRSRPWFRPHPPIAPRAPAA